MSTRVITEVAAAKGESPMDMQPPPYDAIDPSALNALFTHITASQNGTVTFTYNGCTVTVTSSGQVAVQPPTE
ncbi:HalOD1 output domain-containing protein [Natrialba magadii]|uniref:HalOD1 output domain-containing protein n=1 Tax=Natrialba magadii TaxID=13769 RepID=UPI00373AE77C